MRWCGGNPVEDLRIQSRADSKVVQDNRGSTMTMEKWIDLGLMIFVVVVWYIAEKWK